jgi:hypothetical protein
MVEAPSCGFRKKMRATITESGLFLNDDNQ